MAWLDDNTTLALGLMQFLNGLILAALFLTMRFRNYASLVELEGRLFDKCEAQDGRIKSLEQRLTNLEKRP